MKSPMWKSPRHVPSAGHPGKPKNQKIPDRPNLRDQFAMAALTGLIAQSPSSRAVSEFASESYMMADAMMGARK